MNQYRVVVLDDHESVLSGTVNNLAQQYPESQFLKAQTAEDALMAITRSQPDLVIMDLSIPQRLGDKAQKENGIQLLRQLLRDNSTLNVVVQTSFPEVLVRLKPTINTHEGGFAIAPKSLPTQEMLKRVDWALQGLMFTPKEMRTGLEVKPEWLEVLVLAFQEGLQDKAIAERMHLSERTVRNYWTKVQDALEVYPEEGKNIRIQTEIRAREAGLIN